MTDLEKPLIAVKKQFNDNRPKAVLYMNLYCFCNSVVSVMFKLMNKRGVSVKEFMFWKFCGNLLFSITMLAKDKINPFSDAATRGRTFWLNARAVVGLANFTTMMYSISLMPVMLHTIVAQTSSFWTSILGFWINAEKISFVESIGMLLCFVGVILIAVSKDDTSEKQFTLLGLAICFLFSWCTAGINVVNRKLKGVHFAVVGFYQPLAGFFIFLAWIIIDAAFNDNPLPLQSFELYFYITLAVCLDVVAFNSRNFAQQYDTSSFLAVLSYVMVIYGFLADELIFDQMLSGLDLLGAILIFTVALGVAFLKLN